jgi:hypothetical protein
MTRSRPTAPITGTVVEVHQHGRRRPRSLLIAAAVAGLALAVPGTASAHGLVGKQDLPVPQWLFAWAAGVVLVASFVGLAALWQTPRLQDVAGRRVLTVPTIVEVIGGALGVAAFVGLVYAGFAGSQTDTANVLPTVVFVIFWVGAPFASLLFGDVFSLVNPWRAVGRATGWVVARVTAPPEPLDYPQRLGRWPAAIGLLAFAWLELAYISRDDPSHLAIASLVYAAVQLVGMSIYGERTWSRNGDAFGVLYSFIGRLSAFEWHNRVLRLRTPLSGVTNIDMRPGTVALICVAIGTTSFDGFSNGTIWNNIAIDMVPRIVDLGLNANHALELIQTVGIILAVLIIAGLYRLGIQGVHGVDRRHSPAELSRLFAHSLVPIAMAYLVAHYFSLLGYQGQAVVRLLSDPLGEGSDYFGTASQTIDYTWISATGIWYVQVAALVIGHVAGLILAHDRAIAMYDDARTATRSQYWMLGVMICFTCLALYLLSASAQ